VFLKDTPDPRNYSFGNLVLEVNALAYGRTSIPTHRQPSPSGRILSSGVNYNPACKKPAPRCSRFASVLWTLTWEASLRLVA